jgi:hypothetical protein
VIENATVFFAKDQTFPKKACTADRRFAGNIAMQKASSTAAGFLFCASASSVVDDDVVFVRADKEIAGSASDSESSVKPLFDFDSYCYYVGRW